MNVAKKIYLHLGSAAGASMLAATTGLATVKAANEDYALPNPGGGTDFSSSDNLTDVISRLVPNVINVLMLISGILAVLYLIYSGIQYITSAGNADKIKVARAGIINAIIGIVIILAAYFIIRFAVGIGQTVSTSDTQ